MRVFIAVLILIFSLQSWTKANDISDFQIEGMSIGDTLLDYMNKKNIKKEIIEQGYKDDNFKAILLESSNKLIKTYDALYVDYKNDDNFVIHGLAGIIDYEKSIKKCLNKKIEIVNELKLIFPNSETLDDEVPHDADISGESIVYRTSFSFSDFIYLPIAVACFDWTEKMNFNDHLRVAIFSDEYNDWLRTKAY